MTFRKPLLQRSISFPVAVAATLMAAAPTVAICEDRQPAPALSPTPNLPLPNGANAINEVYGAWTVDCRVTDGQKRCILIQAQGNNRTGQRVFAFELQTPKDGRSNGTIFMPFGLNLEAGASLKLDDKEVGQGLRFSTCGSQGCLLPVSFPSATLEAVKKGSTLTVTSLICLAAKP
jgi:invasion protein IalB